MNNNNPVYIVTMFNEETKEVIIPDITFDDIKHGTKNEFLYFLDSEGFEIFIATKEILTIQRKVSYKSNSNNKGDEPFEQSNN